MIYIIKQEGQGCIKTRSTPASISPTTVKWAITNIHRFHRDQATCLPHKILHNHCFQFFLGITTPREIKHNGYVMG